MASSNRTSPVQEIPVTIQRVAIYPRVSTKDQNCELQLRELREYAERRGWKIAGEYIDRGISGSKDSRPQLNRLMAEAHQRKVDAIVVWKIDRFGRSLTHLVTALADLNAYGVAFISLRDNLDLSTPSGRLMFHVVAAMAEFERELIRERVRAGLANASRFNQTGSCGAVTSELFLRENQYADYCRFASPLQCWVRYHPSCAPGGWADNFLSNNLVIRRAIVYRTAIRSASQKGT